MNLPCLKPNTTEHYQHMGYSSDKHKTFIRDVFFYHHVLDNRLTTATLEC